MATLSATIDGIRFRNPVLVGSGPPSATFASIDRARKAGFGGVVIKTVSPDDQPIENVAPRYAKLRDGAGQVIGFQNVELIATEELATWLDTVKRLKDTDPGFVVITSFMAPCDRPDDWISMVNQFTEAGTDGFEINASCPHGFADRGMGAAIGEDPELVGRVCAYVRSATKLPVWLKLTPNVLAQEPTRQALRNGASGVSAINTVRCIMGVDLADMHPVPKISGTGLSTTGGYSGKAVLPIALARVNDAAHVIHDEFGGRGTLSGIGGIEDWQSAAQHFLLGADTVQICTAIMLHGFEVVVPVLDGLQNYLESNGLETISDLSGRCRDSIQPFPVVQAHYNAARTGVVRDRDWQPAAFTKQVDDLT